MTDLGKNYWTNRYELGHTQWDAGHITTPLQIYFDSLPDKNTRILIPGGGNGHEAAYLHENGFKEVFLLDFSPVPLANFQKRYPDFPAAHLLEQDFFTLNEKFDLMVEQTFFCALEPAQRPAYARQAAGVLKPGGKLVGLLFDAKLNDDQPPFGGSREEYRAYFEAYFYFDKFESCTSSIKPRLGKELWIELVRK
ncbi:methyltransferase domain-containing protein [Nafulsella turpanensis]|uniref:methyltransferase domain-containing protein n=1 Tax=Nafulsella turpanensis TaxID=1265690 RepID=UPI00047763F9|nr:methyltransferase domain-containing protein [Nafulsella turpanensis]